MISTFLSAGAGAFIGGCIGGWLVTHWLFNRIGVLERDVEVMQEAMVRMLHEIQRR
jgi:hypothetical protein